MIRIVKMTFRAEHCDDFLAHFDTIKEKICSMPGCESLRLHRDLENPCVFFTYSSWQANESLQQYRQSELFRSTWSTVKAWFDDRAQAWSVDTIFDSQCK